MCRHTTIQVGECRVCTKCGTTLLPDGRIFFDRKLMNYRPKKGKGKGNGKKKK